MRLLIKLLVVLIIVIGIAIYRDYSSTAQAPLRSHIASAPVVDEVVAVGIDLPAGKKITPADVKSGKYPLIALRVANNQYVLNIVTRMGPLWTFDHSLDGIINNSDPVYSQFVLAHIHPDTNTVTLVPISNAGIQAILLDVKEHITLTNEPGLPPGHWKSHSQVVMSDGSKWFTFHIPLSTTYLNNLKAEPNSNQVLIPPSA